MRFRRHLPPVREWTLPGLDPRGAKRWGLALLGAVLTGYLTAYLIIFPTPILHGHQGVPRVLGLSLPEASEAVRKAGLQVQERRVAVNDPQQEGRVVFQQPPAGTTVRRGRVVTIFVGFRLGGG